MARKRSSSTSVTLIRGSIGAIYDDSVSSESPPIKRGKLYKLCLFILYLEVVINILNGILTLVSPPLALDLMTTNTSLASFNAEAGEAARWFASVGIAFGGFLLLRVLLLDFGTRKIVLKYLLEALLVGDVLYLSSLIPFSLKYSSYPGIVLPYILTLLMFVARLYLLISNQDESR